MEEGARGRGKEGKERKKYGGPDARNRLPTGEEQHRPVWRLECEMTEAIHLKYEVPGDDFTRAGEASADLKARLKKLGLPSEAVRRAAIALYEAEINLAIHAGGGHIEVEVRPEEIDMQVADEGPGIPDLNLALSEGWSTAPDEVRSLGFGAGMGLPNMKSYTDDFAIESEVGVGTRIRMKVSV